MGWKNQFSGFSRAASAAPLHLTVAVSPGCILKKKRLGWLCPLSLQRGAQRAALLQLCAAGSSFGLFSLF
ncbi:hypothetical protein N9L31_00015 [bacterium]|nr:hypothetical protein [bacterium]